MSKPTFTGILAAAMAAALAAAGCSDGSTGPTTVGSDVTLSPGQFQLFGGAQGRGPLRFPAAGPAGAEYLVVGQFATDTADVSSAYVLAGTSPPAASQSFAAVAGPGSGVPAALQFHDAIRRMDEAAARASLALAARGLAQAPPVAAVPPVVGTQRTFKVCGDITCGSLVQVSATAQYVGAHAAIFLDDSAPPNGFSASDLSQMGQQFDTDLYPIDHNAFGAESDIDNNGVVLILLTKKVNALVASPACKTSFVTGFFLGADLAPATRTQYNNGEVFYGMVPDPTGAVTCAYSVAEVRNLIPVTFIHEFQHMISFNQHVLVRNGNTELLWLNEALSHLAEELGGWHYDSLGIDSTKSRFWLGNLYNLNLYLQNPALRPMVTVVSPGTLEERGAEWLFVRYLVDRFGATTTQRLVQTSLLGSANVTSVTGTPFATLVGRWALAVWASDLPSFTPDSLLTFRQWRFRTTYASLHTQDPADFPRVFPLVPVAASSGAFSATGTVTSGSGAYVDISLAPGSAAFSVTFQAAAGAFAKGGNPQLAVVRIK